jgi:hypothetical protein
LNVYLAAAAATKPQFHPESLYLCFYLARSTWHIALFFTPPLPPLQVFAFFGNFTLHRKMWVELNHSSISKCKGSVIDDHTQVFHQSRRG